MKGGLTFIALALTALGAVWAVGALGVLHSGAAVVLALLVVAASLYLGFSKKLLDKQIDGKVASLGVPVILAMVSQNAVNVVDTAFVGALPPEVALPGTAAIGVSLPVFWLVGGFLSAIGIGTQAIVARRHGEGDERGAGRTLMSSAPMAFVLGISFSFVGYLALPAVLPFFNDNPSVVEQGLLFARVRYIGISSMVITAAYKAFFDGTGQTRVHMVAAIVMNVVNLILCWGLIFGNWGMPRMEVAGAAWASTLSSIIGTVVMIGATFLPATRARFALYRKGTFDWRIVKRITTLSLPAGAATVLAMGGFLAFHKAVAALDALDPSGLPLNAAATSVIQQIVLLVFLVSFAFATATASLVSRSMGNSDFDLAKKYAQESAKLGTLVMAAVVTPLFLYPDVVLGLFMKSGALGDETAKALAIATGVGPLRLIAVASVALTAGVVFMQALYGAGNTLFVAVVEGILHVTCLAPLAWIFGVTLGGGLIGAWAAIALYILLLAIIMALKFTGGSWQKIKL